MARTSREYGLIDDSPEGPVQCQTRLMGKKMLYFLRAPMTRRIDARDWTMSTDQRILERLPTVYL